MENLLYNTEEHLLQAREYLDEWAFIKAKRVLEELLENEPDHAAAHELLGYLYTACLGDWNKGLYHLQWAIKFDPGRHHAFKSYLILLNKAGHYKEVVAHADRYLQQFTMDKALVWFEKGKALELLLQFEAAIHCFATAILHTTDDELITICNQAKERVEQKQQKPATLWLPDYASYSEIQVV